MLEKDNWSGIRGENQNLAKMKKIKEIIQQQEPTFLGKSGMVNGKPTYNCPCCTSGRGKNRTGIQLIPQTAYTVPKYHCFACGETKTVVDLAIAHYQTASFKEAIDVLKSYYHLDMSTISMPARELTPEQEEAEAQAQYHSEPVECQTEYLKKCTQNLDPSYLEQRGISEKTQRHFWIGTDEEWINPRAKSKKFPTKRCIIPSSHYSYLARDVRPASEIPEFQKKYDKVKYGEIHLFNTKMAFEQNPALPIYVTEGEIDAMSIYEITKGYIQAIGLGGTGMYKEFVQTARIQGPDRLFVLMLDNDNAGQTATKNIKDLFDAYGIKYIVQKFPKEYKDANEYLQKDPQGLRQTLLDTLNDIRQQQIAKAQETKDEL